jgi:hypothetical protein
LEDLKMSKYEVFEALKNGVKVYDLSDIVEEDFLQAQEILDNGDYTSNIDAEHAYNNRVYNEFVGVYECLVDSKKEYQRFEIMLHECIDSSEWTAYPSIEDWMSNKIEDNGRVYRMGKWLKKQGFPQSIIDFYSSQTRTDKEKYYLTISDLPQHIVGMTYNASDWKSCQHPDNAESIHLGGTLHDNRILIGMLHKSLDDLQNMEDLLLARVVMRITGYEGKTFLYPSRVYGNSTHQDIMERCLDMIEEIGVMPLEVKYNHGDGYENMLRIREVANGSFTSYMFADVHIDETVEEEVEAECPMCEGSGKYEVWASRIERDVEVKCPACNGSGDVTAYVCIEIDEYIEVEEEAEIFTYADDYEHEGHKTVIQLHRKRFEEYRKRVNMIGVNEDVL